MSDSQPHLVLHVIDSLGNVGGAEQQLVEQLRRFSDPRLRHAVVCLYQIDISQTREELLPEHVNLHHLFAASRPRPNRWTIQRHLNSTVRRLQPDLIHCALPDASFAARVVAWRRNLLLIETLVNISHEKVRTADNPIVTPAKLAFHRWIDMATMRSVTRFQALSPAVAESWNRVVGLEPDRIVVIPRGIDLEMFSHVDRDEARSVLRAELSLPENAFVLLNLGREQPQKGQRFLIEAMPEIVESVPGSVLLIAGSPGLQSPTLRKQVADRGLESVVRFLGRRRDVSRLLGGCDLFVFPSLYEGLGVSLLEAMAAGLPVITTDHRPMNETITHGVNGLLVSPGSAPELAAAVRRLASDPGERQRLGRAAQQKASADYSIERVVRQVEQLYVSTLGI